jgi:acyl-CoA synthetase (AMP-forming)/AMP-acid ligase II
MNSYRRRWEVPLDRPWFKSYPPGVNLTIDLPEMTLVDILNNSARFYGYKDSIIYYGNRITYKDLLDYVEKLATYLKKQGIKKGDHVGIYMLNSPLWVISYFGILRANGVVVPINPFYKSQELEYIIKDSGIKMIITTTDKITNLEGIYNKFNIKILVGKISQFIPSEPEIPVPDFIKKDMPVKFGDLWEDALKEKDPPQTEITPEDIAMIPYTAGTTGTPKGVIHTHLTILSNVLSATIWERVTSSAVHLVTLPLFHVTGLIHSLLSPVYTGSTMVIMTIWDPKTALKAIEKYKVTHWISIATMLFDILSIPELQKTDLSSLRMCGGGGMPVPVAIGKKFEELTGVKYMEGYGLTETISQTHMNPPEKPKYGSVGIPDFNVDALIMDPDSKRILNPGEIGEIIVNGPEIFLGYWNKPKETEEAFVEINGKRYFRTGDVGYMDNDGYFYIVDRLKRMINRAGLKVWPNEVENILYGFPPIKEVAIVGVPDERVGEEVKAFIVLKDEYKGKVTPEEIQQWLKDKIASYKIPKIIEFVDSLPRSGAGKIDWRILQEKEKEKFKKERK